MNNMYGYGNGYPGGFYQGGYMYQEPPKLNMTQGLTKDQLNSLKKTGGFDMNISEEDLLRSFCTHRQDDRFSVSIDDEGNMICALCGTKFKPFDGTVAEARDLVNRVVDLLETTKMQSLTLPPQTIRDFFQVEPMLKKLPELFSISQNDRKRAFPGNEAYVYGENNNSFVAYQNMVNPLAGNGYFDPAMNFNQPVYGAQAPMGQPAPQYGYQQPQGAQMMNAPQYGGYPQGGQMAPQYGYNPQGQMMNPAQGNPFSSTGTPTAAPTSQAATEQEQVTVHKTLTD